MKLKKDMKNLTYILSIFLLLASLSACEKNLGDSGPFSTTSPVLSPLGQTEWILEKPDAGENPFLFRVNWSKARFTYPSGNPAYVNDVTYTAQIDLADNQFSQAIILESTDKLYTDIYAGQLFDVLVNLTGDEHYGVQNLAIRVKVVYPDGEIVYSNEVLFTVKEPAPITVRWMVTGGSWAEMAVYVWGAGELFGGWPGEVVTPDGDGWYAISIPYKFEANVIINNNGNGEQWNLVSIPTLNAQDVDLYVNLETGDIYKSKPVTVTWIIVAGSWADMYIYAWGDADLFGSWPGRKLTANLDGSYSIAVPSEGAVNLIINNDAGNQVDLISNPTENVTLYVDLNTGEVSTGPKVVKWKVVNGSWANMYVYSWGTDNNYYGGWPGKIVTPDAYGWYSTSIAPGYDQHLIINNNSGNQWDMPYPTVDAQYEVNLTTGTFVQAGEWSITIRWRQPANEWGGQMAIYAWGGDPSFDTFGGWPGQVVTAGTGGWYSVTVPPGQKVGNVILNNNNGGQQFDVNLNITNDVCLEITGSGYSIVTCD